MRVNPRNRTSPRFPMRPSGRIVPAMPNMDALVLAGDVAEMLEGYGVVSCGRREDGVARVDFWTRDGRVFHVPVSGEETPFEVLHACLALAGLEPRERRVQHWS